MKKIHCILLFCSVCLLIHAQGKKGNSGTGGNNNKPGSSEKDIPNFISDAKSGIEKVEFYDLASALANPGIVTSLKLNHQNLTEVPKEISKFINLTELDLSDNQIADFTSKLSGLNNLKTLNLSGNLLTVVPPDVCSLKNLKSLNLSNNKISSGSFSCLPGIERLFLNNNDFSSLPAGITELQSLKTLCLHFNKLTTLEERLARMPNLEVLTVQFNKIIEQPIVFQHNGIINYMFYPQAVNNKYLYKYMSAGSLSSVRSGSNIKDDAELLNEKSSFLAAGEKIEDYEYNIKSYDAGNRYRRIKIDDYSYTRYSKFRVNVLFPLGFYFLVSPVHWAVSKNFRDNYRLSKIYHLQNTVDRITSKSPNGLRRKKVKRINLMIIRTYRRYLKANNISAN